jgi:tRNA 2-selenouridine synthase
MTLLKPSELYALGAGIPTFQLLDVRAPVEVERGAMPYSIFEPILTNEERHEVGLCYKEKGQQAAIDLGYSLTAPHMPKRIESWRKTCQAAPTAIACWRGGLRSKLASEFIGLDVPRIEGGYKALRNHVMEQLEQVVNSKQFIVLTGLTGSGKTKLLRYQVLGDGCQVSTHHLAPSTHHLYVIDLELEANHRGSAFGKQGQQPSQATFENSLATKLLLSPYQHILLEDESRSIGRVWIPEILLKKMFRAPMIVLEVALEERVQNIFVEYVQEPTLSQGQEITRQNLESNILRLYKRLGWENVKACIESLDKAQEKGWLEASAHLFWIETLLTQYYDPLYKKSLYNYERTVLFQGNAPECKTFLTENNHWLGA